MTRPDPNHGRIDSLPIHQPSPALSLKSPYPPHVSVNVTMSVYNGGLGSQPIP